MSVQANTQTSVVALKTPGANRSLPARIARGLRAQPTGIVGLILILLYLGVALFGDQIAPYPYDEMGVGPLLVGPSNEHLFGTDEFGRDVFSRVLYGAPISLRIGLFVVVLSTLLGSTVGLISGFAGGWIDEILMRITDVFLSVPAMVLAVTVSTALGPSITNLTIGIAMARWTIYARLMRSEVLSRKTADYVLAARAIGTSPRRILLTHILPNSYTSVLVQATLDFGIAILFAAGLSFIGAGAQPPSPEWGAMVAKGRDFIRVGWWIAAFPGFAIFGLVLGFNLLGDAVRDALDPRLVE